MKYLPGKLVLCLKTRYSYINRKIDILKTRNIVLSSLAKISKIDKDIVIQSYNSYANFALTQSTQALNIKDKYADLIERLERLKASRNLNA